MCVKRQKWIKIKHLILSDIGSANMTTIEKLGRIGLLTADRDMQNMTFANFYLCYTPGLKLET